MQQNHEALADTLNELIRINFDRVFGYEKAASEVEDHDIDLKAMFNGFANVSRQYIAHWQQQVRAMGQEPAEDSTVRGKVYRVWMDMKSTITGHDRESILNSCVFGEKAAIDAYEDALSTETHLPDEHRVEIASQKAELQAAHRAMEMYAHAHEKVG